MAVSRSHAIILTPKDPDLPHRSVENNFNDASIGSGGEQCNKWKDYPPKLTVSLMSAHSLKEQSNKRKESTI